MNNATFPELSNQLVVVAAVVVVAVVVVVVLVVVVVVSEYTKLTIVVPVSGGDPLSVAVTV